MALNWPLFCVVHRPLARLSLWPGKDLGEGQAIEMLYQAEDIARDGGQRIEPPLAFMDDDSDLAATTVNALSERILSAGLDEHLDDEREAGGPANRRNGVLRKSVLMGTSKMRLSIPRERAPCRAVTNWAMERRRAAGAGGVKPVHWLKVFDPGV